MPWGLSLEIWTQFLSCRLGRAANVIFLDVHLSCRQLGCILGNALAPLKTVSGCHDIRCSCGACSRNPSRLATRSSESEHWKVETWLKNPKNLHSVKRLCMQGKKGKQGKVLRLFRVARITLCALGARSYAGVWFQGLQPCLKNKFNL